MSAAVNKVRPASEPGPVAIPGEATRHGRPLFGVLPRFPLPRLAPPSFAWRWLCVLSLLVGEILALTLRFDTQSFSDSHLPLAVWAGSAPALLKIGLAAGAAFLMLIGLDWRSLPDPRQYADSSSWGLWLGAHLAGIGAFTYCSSVVFFGAFPTRPHAASWLLCWAACGGGRSPSGCGRWPIPVLAAGRAAAVRRPAGSSGGRRRSLAQRTTHAGLWRPLAGATFWLVRTCLGVLYTDITVRASERVLGAAHFQVAIDPACSGYGGSGW
jgi:hypothetical protein